MKPAQEQLSSSDEVIGNIPTLWEELRPTFCCNVTLGFLTVCIATFGILYLSIMIRIHSNGPVLHVLGYSNDRLIPAKNYLTGKDFKKSRFLINNFYTMDVNVVSSIDNTSFMGIQMLWLDTRALLSDEEIEVVMSYLIEGGSVLFIAYPLDECAESAQKIFDYFGISINTDSPTHNSADVLGYAVPVYPGFEAGKYGSAGFFYGMYMTEFYTVTPVEGVTQSPHLVIVDGGNFEGKAIIYSNVWQFEDENIGAYISNKALLMNSIDFLVAE